MERSAMTIDMFLVCHQGLLELQVRGQLRTRDDATEIVGVLAHLPEWSPVVIDLSIVEDITTTGAQALVEGLRSVQAAGADVSVACGEPRARARLIDAATDCGLHGRVEPVVVPTVVAARQNLSARPVAGVLAD
jgi:anti-anti-sigma regulatory factor